MVGFRSLGEKEGIMVQKKGESNDSKEHQWRGSYHGLTGQHIVHHDDYEK